VTLKLVIEVSSQTGTATIGGIQQPIISQRKIEHDIRLKEGEVSILGGLFERTDTQTKNGYPGLASIPILRRFFSDDKTDHQENEVLLVLTPRIVRMPEWTFGNMRPLYTGSETNPQVRRESDIRAPSQQHAAAQPPTGQQPPANSTPAVQNPTPDVAATKTPKIRFEPQMVSLKTGQKATLGLVVENVTDLYSLPLLVQYNPAVVSLEEVQHARDGFLSGGTQEIAIVQQIIKEKGQAIISATRQPNTPGVNGSGTLLGIVVKAIAPGASNISIVQVNAKDSQQKPIPLVASEATVQVQP
jgi:general secretion pathway protein D